MDSAVPDSPPAAGPAATASSTDPGCRLVRRWFLRGLGFVYFTAFFSLATQIVGLVGREGILPAGEFLESIRSHAGDRAVWMLPTLCWLDSSDGFIAFLCYAGAFLSVFAMVGFLSGPIFCILWIAYLSVVNVGQDFLGFQWDMLLLETGFLALFLAPWRVKPSLEEEGEPPREFLWLARWLLFRLMFSSGAVKLLSGDETWRALTALQYHYESQPLPTPLAWFAHWLPVWFHTVSSAVMFAIELAVPFLVFGPRGCRLFAFWALLLLQVLIALTGNYCYFNLLTVVLLLPLLDDRALRKAIPSRWRTEPPPALVTGTRGRADRIGRGLAAAFVLVVSFEAFAGTLGRRLAIPIPGAELLRWTAGFNVASGYGLFAVMTTVRNEIVVEGSRDGENWVEYEFAWKPGDPVGAPPIVAPHQPRLDWQMWFAALGGARQQRWFLRFAKQLLAGSPEVLSLLARDPFDGTPPRFIRARLLEYRFTDAEERARTGAWWKREERGLYMPALEA